MNPYEVLDITEEADDEAVHRAYLAAVRRHPPDRDPDAFARIRDAYEMLRRAEQRTAMRIFGVPEVEALEDLERVLPHSKRFVGPGPWLEALRG
ncbi:MAG: J domain-containing protein [Planctomycetota bacterium]